MQPSEAADSTETPAELGTSASMIVWRLTTKFTRRRKGARNERTVGGRVQRLVSLFVGASQPNVVPEPTLTVSIDLRVVMKHYNTRVPNALLGQKWLWEVLPLTPVKE